jgi:hypothetical protein
MLKGGRTLRDPLHGEPDLLHQNAGAKHPLYHVIRCDGRWDETTELL